MEGGKTYLSNKNGGGKPYLRNVEGTIYLISMEGATYLLLKKKKVYKPTYLSTLQFLTNTAFQVSKAELICKGFYARFPSCKDKNHLQKFDWPLSLYLNTFLSRK